MSIRALAAGLLAFAATATPVAAQQTVKPSAGPVAVTTLTARLEHPWSLAFLPDGRMLVTERPGRMRIVDKDGKTSEPLAGVPKVIARSQAGLMDVILARDFAQSRRIFFCYAAPVSGGAQIAVARAMLDAGTSPKITAVTKIYEQK